MIHATMLTRILQKVYTNSQLQSLSSFFTLAQDQRQRKVQLEPGNRMRVHQSDARRDAGKTVA